jgi:ribonuclease HI
VLLIANPSGRTAHFDPNRLQLNLTKAANLLGWVPPKVNSMMHVLHTKNYTATSNVAATFSIPTKLRKLVDHSSDDSDYERDMDYEFSQAASTNAEPHILSLLSEIQPLVPQRLRWDARSIIYTDGSCVEKENGTHALGAGVCRPNCQIDTAHVLPCGVGPTNTINRAELCAIYHAVKHTCQFNRDETIATDSLCSLHMINRGIRRPHTLRHSKHRELVTGIVQCVKQRATRGYTTRFIKVKSHTGIEGNEMADAIAKKAVDIFFQDISAHEVSIGRHPYATMFWLATNTVDDTNENNGGQLAMSERYVHNLNQDLATRAYNTQGLAGTNESIYANLMKQELLTADKKISSAMWDLAANGTLTYAHITNAMRIRWGGIYTAKIAARMNRPYMGTHGPPSSGQCPLCGGADSATHIMGECPAHKALHIQRHDATGRCILKHMRKGAHGGYYMIADVGSMEKLAPLGIVHKRIPDWMMPVGAAAPSRFDIAMLHRRDLDVIDGVTPASQTPFTTIEIGYRSDYDPDLKKLAEKQLQHAPTCAALGQHYKLDYQIWDVGHTGMIPKRLREQAIRLGVSNVDKLLKEIHTIALQHALYIMHERRAKEKEKLTHQLGSTSTHMPVGLQRTNAPPR